MVGMGMEWICCILSSFLPIASDPTKTLFTAACHILSYDLGKFKRMNLRHGSTSPTFLWAKLGFVTKEHSQV